MIVGARAAQHVRESVPSYSPAEDRPPDIPAVADIIARLSRLAEDGPEIAELDLNPVIVLPDGQGCHIVDVRMRVA